MYIPSKLTRLILLGLWLGARLWSQNCDTIVLVHAGQWHNHGDTLRTTSAFLTAYPRLMGGGGPGYVYTWYWWLQQISPAGNFSQSGSLSGSSPTLNTPLNPNASRPTFYELWLLLYRYGVTGGHVCTDSARIIVRVDTPPSNPWHHLCQDTFRLVIGGRQVRLGGTVQLPLGTYTFDFSPRDIIYWWTLTGPSGPQSGGAPNPPNASPVGTVHLSSAGRHTLTIAQYWPPCLGIVDTLKFYIDAINPSASHNCSTTVLSPCVPLLTIGNASYLPGPNPITLANGTYTFSLSSATPPAGVPLLINYYWQICGAGLPNGCLSGTGNSITVPIGPASYFLTVITHATWLCPTTMVCTDTNQFVLSGGSISNDTVIVIYPGDSTSYSPNDTILLPLDTVCLYPGIQTPHPDSVYGWWWTYYSPTGVPLDSGVTSVTCLYPTQPGLYSLVYGVNPRPNARTAQGRRYTFYLNFGARTTAASSLAERIPILYPNPTSGTVYLQLPSTVPYRVEVKDVLGRCHYHTELMGGDTHRLTLPLPSGLYLMEVKSNEHNTSFRLLIQ